MADITMCSGIGCDMKHECYRHTAEMSHWQSWFSVVPIKDGKCDMFWDNKLKEDKEDGKFTKLNALEKRSKR
jgi:hypothetical protein